METISKSQRNLLLVILGICILFFPIKYLAMGNFDDKKKIDSEKSERETYYNDLKAKDKNRQQYIDDTAKYKEDYEKILAEFPSELYQENTIMYLQGIKTEYKLDFTEVQMGEETLFYTLGVGATGDVSLGETAPATDENGELIETTDGYNCYSATFPTTYAGSYQSIKDVIDYIMASEFKMSLDAIDIVFNEDTGNYEGALTFSSYAVNGGERTTDQVDVNVKTGTNNIFGNPTAKSSGNATQTTTEQ